VTATAVKKQATYDMQEDTPVPEAASAQTGKLKIQSASRILFWLFLCSWILLYVTGMETEQTAPQQMPAPASNPVIL